MALPGEPGRRLLLCVQVVDKATQTAVCRTSVHLYHATDNGEYEPLTVGDESTARLSGSAQTDDRGRIFVETILPGDYGSSADNRHIHTTVRGSQPEAYDIHFKQYSTFMLRRFVNRSDQHFLVDLRRTATGELVGTVTIAAKFPE